VPLRTRNAVGQHHPALLEELDVFSGGVADIWTDPGSDLRGAEFDDAEQLDGYDNTNEGW